MDAVLAAVDVAAVVFTVRGKFARRHVLAEARRHLLETLRGQEFSRGLDDYIANRALAAGSAALRTCCRVRPEAPVLLAGQCAVVGGDVPHQARRDTKASPGRL
ncbi:hypothetical protein ABZ763_31840 [Streptomyces bacillaris]|uniref:hypothetical protein n=1 Tax=Streptomyces bacillaris TaxID=68179 RepID=UPI0034604728